MKKLILATLFFLVSSIIAPSALAVEEGPPIPIVEMFDTRYLEILEGGKLYQGIFMPENEYQTYTKLKIDYQFTKKSLDILEANALGLQEILAEHKKLELDILDEIKEVKEVVVKENWWQDNKFYIGVGIGAIATGLIIAGIQAL